VIRLRACWACWIEVRLQVPHGGCMMVLMAAELRATGQVAISPLQRERCQYVRCALTLSTYSIIKTASGCTLGSGQDQLLNRDIRFSFTSSPSSPALPRTLSFSAFFSRLFRSNYIFFFFCRYNNIRYIPSFSSFPLCRLLEAALSSRDQDPFRVTFCSWRISI